MNTRNRTLIQSCLVLGLAAGVIPGRTVAQVPAGLDLQTYAGLTITGAVATVYSIEYVSDLTQANPASGWRCLEFLQLPSSPYLWTDKSTPATGQRFYRAVAFPAPRNMVFIPPGTFRMGSPTNEVDRNVNEGPQTEVTINQGFWMGMYEVTQGEYVEVMGRNPSLNAGDPDRPVEAVSWADATNYCSKLNLREGTAGLIPANCAYRLPTEAEWEYACRAWTSTRFGYGDDPGYTNLASYAWYVDNSGNTTHRVGQKLPNAWGLYDMNGNVWEWCQDHQGTYPGGIAFDPEGPAQASLRVIRGGCWFSKASSCRSAFRYGDPGAGGRFSMFGFRVVMAPKSQGESSARLEIERTTELP